MEEIKARTFEDDLRHDAEVSLASLLVALMYTAKLLYDEVGYEMDDVDGILNEGMQRICYALGHGDTEAAIRSVDSVCDMMDELLDKMGFVRADDEQ